MRYGLSLLVCFALTACISAAEKPCPDGKCKVAFDAIVAAPVRAVVAAPVAAVRGVTSSCCGIQATAQHTGPIRKLFRKRR